MSEYLFRAWDAKQNYMAYQGSPDLETIQSFMFHYGDKPLMLFSGFTDKSAEKRKIFAGDYLKPLSENIGVMKVVFENGSFVCYHKYGRWGLLSRCFDFDIENRYSVEVVGNECETLNLKFDEKEISY